MGGPAASTTSSSTAMPGDLAISVDVRSRVGERSLRDCRRCTRGRVPGSPHPRPVRRGRPRSRTARRGERVARIVVGVRQPHHRSPPRAPSFRLSRALAPRRAAHHPRHRHPARGSRREGNGRSRRPPVLGPGRDPRTFRRIHDRSARERRLARLAGVPGDLPTRRRTDRAVVPRLARGHPPRRRLGVRHGVRAHRWVRRRVRRPVAAPDGSAVAYVLTREEASQPSTVFVLRAGDRRGEAVYRVPAAKACHRAGTVMAPVRRRRRGPRRHRSGRCQDAIDLSELGDRLEMLGDGLVARWPHCRAVRPRHHSFVEP